MSQHLVDYILNLPGGVDEFRTRVKEHDLPMDMWQEVIMCRKQQWPRTPIPSRATLYNLIASVYPTLRENKEAYAKQQLAQGKSVTEVAKAMGLHRNTIQNWKKKWNAAKDEAAPA